MKKNIKNFFIALILIFINQFTFAFTENVVVSGMDRPWAVISGPDGNIWISEKFTGQIRVYDKNFILVKKISGFPKLQGFVEAGLLDFAFHPQFNNNKKIFVIYSVKSSSGYKLQLNRFTLANSKLTEQKILFEGPDSDSGHHFGSRLLFDDEGMLLATFGERLDKDKAQDMTTAHGKVIRLTEEGQIPANNPFGPTSPIFSLGHRNSQGLAIHPKTRKIYSSEHGPSGFDGPMGGDEINQIKAGANYGWPLYHHRSEPAGYELPLLEYTPAVAPSGISFYTGQLFPEWKNNLFVATLRGQQLIRLRLNEQGQIEETESLLVGKYGRLRDVDTGPDGSLLVLAEDGRLIQLK